jgi:hypothetical protein
MVPASEVIMRLASFSLFGLLGLVSLLGAACASTTGEPSSSGDEAVTGVTDLDAVEAELALVKDVQDEHGAWSRPEAKLQSGPCFKQTVGGSNGASYEFRRYRQGAAFFMKRGAGPMAGDKRAIRCIDVDITPLEKGDASIVALSGVTLDTVMRYHFGKPVGYDAGLGHLWANFERGTAEVKDSEHYCGFYGDSGERSPGADAFAQAITTCKEGGGSEDDCSSKAMTACKKAVVKDVARDTIDRPAFDTIDENPSMYLWGLQIPTNDNGSSYMSASLASAVYRYALKVGASHSAFTLTGDPIGKFVKLDWVAGQSDNEYTEHARFEHADAHHIIEAGIERLAITPKGADAKVVDAAFVLCTRTVNDSSRPTTAYQCRGL